MILPGFSLSISVLTRLIPHPWKSVLQEGQGLSHGSAVIEISSSVLINNPTALKRSWEWGGMERGRKHQIFLESEDQKKKTFSKKPANGIQPRGAEYAN